MMERNSEQVNMGEGTPAKFSPGMLASDTQLPPNENIDEALNAISSNELIGGEMTRDLDLPMFSKLCDVSEYKMSAKCRACTKDFGVLTSRKNW
jgi:hypothetical protein